jgi:Carboxypeptidase regulatory-like domain
MARKVMTLALVLFAFCTMVGAQGGTGGSISGSVKDSSGAVIVGATVTAHAVETGIVQTVTTDEQGYYVFPIVPLGHYVVQVRQTGFKLFEVSGLVIDVNTALRVDATLEVGAQTQSVEVTGSALQVETTSTQMGELIGGQQIASIPLNGRSYTDLLALQPGVSPQHVSVGIEGTQYSVSGELNPGTQSISGQRETSNGFVVNGASVEEFRLNGTAVIPNLDSISEFRILTNNVEAEYGNYNGGLINVATKSGTNQLHGDAFEFLRNTIFDARNYYSPTVGAFQQNQFGGVIGGPVVRDKVFFFGDYQGTRLIEGVATGLIQVPSMADRTGNISDLANSKTSGLSDSVVGAYWANQLSEELGYAVTAGEPYYKSTCTSTAACVFPGAVIPQSAMPIPTQRIISDNLIPQPTQCNTSTGQCFFSTSAYDERLRDDKGASRVDANTRYGLISAYYFIDDYLLNNPYGQVSLPGYYTLTPGQAQLIDLSDTKTLSATTVNEIRLAYVRDKNIFNEAGGGLKGPNLAALGFVTGAGTLGDIPQAPAFAGVPDISTGLGSIGAGDNINNSVNNSIQVDDNFSKLVRAHSLKFGGSYYRNQVNTNLQDFDNGSFSFGGTETGNAWADFLIGALSGFTQGVEEPVHDRNYYFATYAEDSWRARSSVTLNYGLRWEISPAWTELHNEQNVLDPGVQSATFPGSPVGWVFPGDPGIPRTVQPIEYHDLAPRFGLAYAPSAHSGFWGKLLGAAGTSSIRASWGLYYTAVEDESVYDQLGAAPFGNFYESPSPPEFLTPYVTRATGISEGQRFPVTYPPANASATNPDNNIDWATFLPISGSPGLDIHNKTPYTEDYALSLQREFGGSTLISASYVGAQGHRLLSTLESNAGNAALCLSLSQPSEVASGSLTCGPKLENDTFTTAAGQTVLGTRMPFGHDFSSNNYYAAQAYSNYNSLEATVRHSTGRLVLLGSYTYSKCLANSSDIKDNISPINPRDSYALCAWDVEHDFVTSYNYELPFDQISGKKNRLTQGWYISGATRFSTGTPITMGESDDRWLLGTSDETPVFTPGKLLNDTNPRDGQAYFNTSLFSKDALGSPGNTPLRFFHGPGINNWDMALQKTVPLTEAKKLEIRMEAFNAFNHAQFSNPSGSVNSSTFGLVTSASAARIFQLGARLSF